MTGLPRSSSQKITADTRIVFGLWTGHPKSRTVTADRLSLFDGGTRVAAIAAPSPEVVVPIENATTTCINNIRIAMVVSDAARDTIRTGSLTDGMHNSDGQREEGGSSGICRESRRFDAAQARAGARWLDYK
ncbi:uncharacterized protein C8Q71DRAFT_859305 [Rhodofomes roseus]|uniref:Uncharacterized protein n=1 Tax=Rhodofomes roseus TaxID=34475 RepID=A0ABQ8KBN8_9APHY|nr:uncharacterized protein C8Q71DRAFT_859305 [Rhodofomes roseus]KAH9834967.1 hypothetical protein C8Q71DRAFT_859305 [Rhodofomes roseus]